jgi:hypothetical protein
MARPVQPHLFLENLMRRKLSLYCLCWLLFSSSALAGERSVFQGMLEGAGMVVLELEKTDRETVKQIAGLSGTALEPELPPETRQKPEQDLYVGRYFYARQGVDIPLFGALAHLAEPKSLSERTEAEACTPEACEMAPKAYWEGKIVQGRFRGQWVDAATKRTHRFDLKRVARYDPEKTRAESFQAITEAIAAGIGSGLAYEAEINPQQRPYEYLKLQGYAVPVGAIVPNQTESVAWQSFRDSRSQFEYPRLVRHPNPDILKRVNDLLEQRHWQMTLAALTCVSRGYEGNGMGRGTLGGYEGETIRVDFLTKTLMSVVEAGSIYCGGPYPHHHSDPFTLDLIRGEYLDWNRLFKAFLRGERGFWEPSPEMMALIEKIPKEEELENCISAETMRDYLALHFDKPGHLALSISKIGHCCGDCLGAHAEIPFSDLGALLKPEAQRYFPELKPTREKDQRGDGAADH